MLLKRLTVLFLVAMAALAALGIPAGVAAQGEGTITGRVVNGTAGAGPVTGVEVTLITYAQDKEDSRQKGTIDDSGAFEFKGLATDSTYSYQATTSYQGVDYASDLVQFSAGEPGQATVELSVYDTTDSDADISVVNGHMVVYVDQAGTLQVLEVWRFSNSGDRTYLAPQGGNTLQFTLPAGATDVSPGEGFLPRATATGIADTAAVPPGVVDISFSYLIPYEATSLTVSRKMDYPAASFGLLVQDAGVTVSSTALSANDPLVMGDARFLYYTGKDLSRGTDVDFSLSMSATPSATTTGSSFPWVWLLVAVLALALVFAIGYPRLRKAQVTAATAPAAGPATEEERGLLNELARLDDEFEAGKLDEVEYRSRRQRAKARLLEIYKEGRGSA